jgi:hypothetical protein
MRYPLWFPFPSSWLKALVLYLSLGILLVGCHLVAKPIYYFLLIDYKRYNLLIFIGHLLFLQSRQFLFLVIFIKYYGENHYQIYLNSFLV